MKFISAGTGWILWEVIDVNGTYNAMLSDVYNPFIDMHQFFLDVKNKKDTTITIDQEGTEFFMSLTFTPFGGAYPYDKGQDALLTIRQTLWPQGQKVLHNIALNSTQFLHEYQKAFKALLTDSSVEGWAKDALFAESFERISP